MSEQSDGECPNERRANEHCGRSANDRHNDCKPGEATERHHANPQPLPVPNAEPVGPRRTHEHHHGHRADPAQAIRRDQRGKPLSRRQRSERRHLDDENEDQRYDAVGAVPRILHDFETTLDGPTSTEPVGHVRQTVVVERSRRERLGRDRE